MERDNSVHETYAPETYTVVKQCLALAARLDTDVDEVLRCAAGYNSALSEFLRSQNIASAWPRMRRGSTTCAQRVRQFHTWFDAFRTLKLIHFLRDNGMPNVDVGDAALTWAQSEGAQANTPEELLMWLRANDRAPANGPPMGLQ